VTGGPTVSVTQAAKVIATSEPQTLQAPKADIELASSAKPLEVKADPAPKQDVDAVASSIGLDLGVKGPLGIDVSAKADAKLASDRDRDRNIRQWSPDWVQYDEYYRPIIMNPYHERVRIVYVYDYQPRIVWIPPLARAILDVAQFAAYSFTAVVDTAANLVNAAVATAVNVAVGSFFGGGFIPAFGQPLPPPPPPGSKPGTQPTTGRGFLDALTARTTKIVTIFDEATAFKNPTTKTISATMATHHSRCSANPAPNRARMTSRARSKSNIVGLLLKPDWPTTTPGGFVKHLAPGGRPHGPGGRLPGAAQ